MHGEPHTLRQGLVLLLCTAAVFQLACASSLGAGGPAPEIGYQAPNFAAQAMTGDPVHLKDMGARPIVLVFWASWCSSCRAELPDLDAAYARYLPTTGLVVLAISEDDTIDEANGYAYAQGLTLPVLFDPSGAVASQYNVGGLPTSFFINAQGEIRSIRVGTMPGEELEGDLHDIFPSH